MRQRRIAPAGLATPGAAMRAAVVAVMLAGARAGASPIQLDPPSLNPASPTWIDRALPPAAGGVALDQVLGSGDSGQLLTLRLNPSLVAGRAGGALGRIGLATTVGGTTPQRDMEWFTRHSGGTNHVTSELKFQILGPGAEAGEPPARVLPVRAAVALGADTYSTGFGRDRYAATLIVESTGESSIAANIAYRQDERLHHGQRDHDFKVGGAWMPRRFDAGPLHALDATLALGGLIRGRGQENVAIASVRVGAPLWRDLRLALAGTASNHAQDIGQSKLQGVLGVSFGR